jgi:hypothetical protein
MSGENPQAHNSSSIDSGLVIHIDMKRHTMAPLKLEIHDLVDSPEFGNEDLILQRVRDMLLEARRGRAAS